EQALRKQMDGRADIYSLGATLFTLLAGHPPFAGSATQKLMAHQLRPVPDLATVRDDLPYGLNRVVARMMAKDPEDRYQSVVEVRAALSACLAGRSADARPQREPRVGAVAPSRVLAGESAETPTRPVAGDRTKRLGKRRRPARRRGFSKAWAWAAVTAGVLLLTGLGWGALAWKWRG